MTVDATNLAATSLEELDYDGHSLTPHKRVPLGPDFQAELPKRLLEGTKSTCRSECELDSQRWLGERVWPIQGVNLMDLDECASRASDYQHSECFCECQGSIECVRLHIKEEREALKEELGDAFCLWGFDEMGETVADKWTNQEQSAFQKLVRSNPESFWNDLFEFFPTKCMADFVSYYFNVFVLRRRAIQNRVSPDNIDSDDDMMILEMDESDDDTLDSSEEVDHVPASENEEESSSMNWSAKDGLNTCLQNMEAVRDGSAESTLRAASLQDRVATIVKESSCDGCCGSSSVEYRNHAWEMLAWENKGHIDGTHCVIDQSDKEAWTTAPPLCSTQDDLISTKGMIEEFFGSETGEHPK
ncbi:hypothetical protein KP509_05G093300 [Ceratopteris richardii]|nr:hypothetical protein KP509_05G093300 [Ceratopteris richardii]KAH7437870.1 hypothetical protein KP509_05G093300 [Ceratopteris richardii]